MTGEWMWMFMQQWHKNQHYCTWKSNFYQRLCTRWIFYLLNSCFMDLYVEMSKKNINFMWTHFCTLHSWSCNLLLRHEVEVVDWIPTHRFPRVKHIFSEIYTCNLKCLYLSLLNSYRECCVRRELSFFKLNWQICRFVIRVIKAFSRFAIPVIIA